MVDRIKAFDVLPCRNGLVEGRATPCDKFTGRTCPALNNISNRLVDPAINAQVRAALFNDNPGPAVRIVNDAIRIHCPKNN